MTTYKYDLHIDLGLDTVQTRVIRLVGNRKNVLELGCATAYMSRILMEQFGCKVTGIECDLKAAAKASAVCSTVIVGDLETLDYARELGQNRYDVIMCADVLEHLRDPVHTLSALRPFLVPDGYVVASIPNIAHVSIIAELIEGRFVYRSHGLLDESHVTFFTRENIYECFERAGFVITHMDPIRIEPEDTEFKTDLSGFPTELLERIRAHEDSTTYEFVLRAQASSTSEKIATLKDAFGREARRIRSSPQTLSRTPVSAVRRTYDAGSWQEQVRPMIEALLGQVKLLEGKLERRAEQLGELRERVANYKTHIRNLQGNLTTLDSKAHHLEEQLSSIQSSTGWRILESYRRIRRKVSPPGSTRERVYQRLVRSLRSLFVDDSTKRSS